MTCLLFYIQILYMKVNQLKEIAAAVAKIKRKDISKKKKILAVVSAALTTYVKSEEFEKLVENIVDNTFSPIQILLTKEVQSLLRSTVTSTVTKFLEKM